MALIELVADEESEPRSSTKFVELIAARTIEATQAGLRAVPRDIGFRSAFFLLTQLAVVGRNDATSVANLGLRVDPSTTLAELSLEAQRVLDEAVASEGARTDISEISQQAFGEAVSFMARQETIPLFEEGFDAIRRTLKAASTKSGFGQLARRFLASFLARYLNFYLSRVTAGGVGGKRLGQLGDISEFNRALDLHCYQSAKIVEDFSAEWFSKTLYREGINKENTTRFLRVALKKLSAELESQKSGG